MDEMTVVTLTGSPHERGWQHGKTLKDGIHRFYQAWSEMLFDSSPFKLTEADLLSFAKKNGPYIKEYAPDIYQEIEGIAEGADMDFDKALYMNCFDEEYVFQSLPQLRAGTAGAPPPGALPAGCTSFAAFGPATADGKVYIGQNYDYSSVYLEPVVFRIEQCGDEPEQLIFSHMGVVGINGVNAAGLAIVENTLAPADLRIGVPFPVVMRKALQQTRLSDLVGAIITAPPPLPPSPSGRWARFSASAGFFTVFFFASAISAFVPPWGMNGNSRGNSERIPAEHPPKASPPHKPTSQRYR